MNWPVIKDTQWIVLTILCNLLSLGAIVLAVFDNDYWIFFNVASLYFLYRSASRAEEIMKLNSKS